MQHISTQTEIWKPVVGYEGYYEVSDHGNVRSIDRILITKTGVRKSFRGRIISQQVRESGHLDVLLQANKVQSRKWVHRMVLESFAGESPGGMVCCHGDDNPANNHIENLRWGTRSDNQYDRVRNGIHPNANQTHCKRGHLLESPNLVPSETKRTGRRSCLSCGRAQDRLRRHPEMKPYLQDVSDDYYRKIMNPAS